MNTVKLWLKGIAAAIIGGAANAITLYIVDPSSFSDWTKLAKLAGVSALVSCAMYLKRSPVPGGKPEA